MSEAAVMPRGNAVAVVAAGTDSKGTARPDGRNRRAAETRRKIIEAAKVMIAETSTAPTVVAVARRADVSVRSVFQHFGDVESLFVTVMDAIRPGHRRAAAAGDGLPSAGGADRVGGPGPCRSVRQDRAAARCGRPVRRPSGPDRARCRPSSWSCVRPLSRPSPRSSRAWTSRPARSWRTRSARRSPSTPGSCCVAGTGSSFDRAAAVWRMTLTGAPGAIGSLRLRRNSLPCWSPIDLAFGIRELRAPSIDERSVNGDQPAS